MRDTAASEIRADSDAIQELAQQVAEALENDDVGRATALTRGVPAPDLADIIELLAADKRVQLIEALGSSFDFEVLSEIDPSVRDQLSEALPNDLLAKAVNELDTDDAAYVIEELDDADRQEILAQLPTSDRAALERNLDYPEETAGRLMQADFVAVAPFWTVGQVIDNMREPARRPAGDVHRDLRRRSDVQGARRRSSFRDCCAPSGTSRSRRS